MLGQAIAIASNARGGNGHDFRNLRHATPRRQEHRVVSEWIQQVQQAGVVGAGGAGFPTHVKLKARVGTLLINAAECEPLLYVDQHLLAQESEALFQAILLCLEKMQLERVIIGAKEKARKFLGPLEDRITNHGDRRLSIRLLSDSYPAGDEQVLIYEILDRIVPPEGLPLDVDCLVINVETLLNIKRACEGHAVTRSYLTVCGAVHHPCTLQVPVGISAREAVALAGGPAVEDYAILDGGPMMGFPVGPEAPVKKTCKGLVVLPADHPLISRRRQSWDTIMRQTTAACIECRMCTDTCPRYLLGHPLEPHKLMRALGAGPPDSHRWLAMARLCCECGVCDLFACPHDLSPRFVSHSLKGRIDPSRKIARPPLLEVRPFRKEHQLPSVRLMQHLKLKPWDVPAPWKANGYAPQEVSIPLRQHLGAPAEPVVRSGERVEQGALIAAPPQGALGANVHASISGKITKIGDAITIKRE